MPRFLRRFRKKLLLLSAIVFSVYIFGRGKLFSYNSEEGDSEILNFDAFLVDTPACKIPHVDPFDPSIYHLVTKGRRAICPTKSPLTYQKGTRLYINWTAAEDAPYHGNVRHCTYTPFYRPHYEPSNKDFLQYLDESEPFTKSVLITHDFVRTNCFDLNEQRVYINFHGFIQPNVTASSVLSERLKAHVKEDKVKDPLNVIMIGIDSVSRLSFLRQMTKTKEFLLQTLDAVDMFGYNKVADNTFVNIVPMTTGKFVEELPWDETKAEEPFDKYNFIWKQFSQNGYRTLYAEDAPEISIFDFIKAGFLTPPADYFNRPMSLAMELYEDLWFNNHKCFQDRLETNVVLDYVYDFVKTFKHDPFFVFTFITRLTHDDVNSAGGADEPYFRFFKELYEGGHLDNTVLFFYSDHGMRFGDIRETYIGKLEERLPFMYLAVPKRMKDKYPFLSSNLKLNEHRLSTPFDVYETLLDILYFQGVEYDPVSNNRGVSWFRKIPIQRSCDDAGILPHWCTCLQHQRLRISDHIVQKTAIVLLSEIKHLLSKFGSICEDLNLYEIRDAMKLVPSEKVLKFLKSKNDVKDREIIYGEKTKSFEDIQILIQTTPGWALFEATVRIDTVRGTFKVVGDISRINMYGHQADCMHNFKLKKYCQCKFS